MRNVTITVDLTDAWEVWSARIPDEVADEDVEQFVRDNIGTDEVEMVGLRESGHSISTIDTVEYD